MKTRTGFVSNSSSSSFIIQLDEISVAQLNKIQNHIQFGRKLGINWCSDHNAWSIDVNGNEVRGETFMDNFDMAEFLTRIGVKDNQIKWSD